MLKQNLRFLAAEAASHAGRGRAPRYLPLAIDMAGLCCLVVGGGRIGTRKALKLAAAGAEVTVLAPQVSAKLRQQARKGHVRWHRGTYEAASLEGYVLVVAATADRRLNLRIRQDADARRILCCVVAPGKFSRVIFPAVFQEERFTVAVHSDGRDCRLSQRVRNFLALAWRKRRGWFGLSEGSARRGLPTSGAGLPKNGQTIPSRGATVQLPHQLERARAVSLRKPRLATSPGNASRRQPSATATLEGVCRQGAASTPEVPAREGYGKVYLVGAGPGAPDLISVRGYRALRSADVVLADQLLPPDFLDELGLPATGKTVEWLGDTKPRWSQEQINERLLFHARAGKTVVRLKGGDPLVFGRGDVEIEFLSRHHVPWEVIPGASSATAVLTAAGLPLTRRAQGRSFAVATARVAGGGLLDSFPRSDSLVILMGMSVLDQVVARLLADGWPPQTPAAVIERGTLPWERRVGGPLWQLDALAADARLASPALVVVGQAAAAMSAFQRRPTILFTGRHPEHFRHLGNLLHWPALAPRTEKGTGVFFVPRWHDVKLVQSPPFCQEKTPVPFFATDRAHPELGRPLPEHDVIFFTSPDAVHVYWETYGPAAFEREVWCLNEPTCEALERFGVDARLVGPAASPDYYSRDSVEADCGRGILPALPKLQARHLHHEVDEMNSAGETPAPQGR